MKKRLQALLLALCLTLGTIGAGCGGRQDNNAAGTETAAATETEKTASVEDSAMAKANAGELNIIDDKYRTYYEVFLYSFYDSDGDGIGDIQGLIDKLDYLNDGDDSTDTDLGCNGIWMMPIMPVVSANMPVARVSTASPNRASTAARASSAASGSASWY